MEELIIVFSTNLKREIKKQGYKITDFAPKCLKISIPTFSKKCKDGTFTLVEIAQIEQILKVSFNELRTKKEDYKYSRKVDHKQLRDKTSDKKETNHGYKDLSYLNTLL